MMICWFTITLLKSWLLMLSYTCPNKCVVYRFYGFICKFLKFPSVKFSKIFTVHWIRQDTNFKHEKSRLCTGSFLDFCKFVFYRCRKTGQIDFAEKRAPTKVKYLLPAYIFLRNFTEGNARKFTVNFAFCTHVDVIKYRKTLTFSFERAQITWATKLFCKFLSPVLALECNWKDSLSSKELLICSTV